MSVVEIIATAIMTVGVALAIVASIGFVRFTDVLSRMHAASKPQILGLLLVFGGAALVAGSWSLAGMLALVLIAQMLTVPVGSTMVGRAAFRRGFIRGGDYAIDELSPRLAQIGDSDEDGDGFIDEFDDDLDGTIGTQDSTDFPQNVVSDQSDEWDRADSNWDEPEAGSDDDDASDLDVDIAEETEREAGEIAEEDARARAARAAQAPRRENKSR